VAKSEEDPLSQSANEGIRGIDSTAALAAHLGLSRWTVSRVLNGHGGVSEKTVERVRSAMKESGFEPNLYARSLRGGRTRTIGVCIQEMDSPSLSRKVSRLQALFRDRDYHCLLELTNRNHSLEEQVLRHFLNLKVDGIVGIGTCLSPASALIGELKSSGISVILVDPETTLPFPTVEVDRSGATESMMNLLWTAGHRTFGFAGFDPDYAYSEKRLEGANRFLERRDGERVWSIYEPGTVKHDFTYGSRLAAQILKQKSMPSAVLAVNDRVAIGLVSELSRKGIKVPENLAVVGHDNLEVSSFFEPTLTTVDQNIRELMESVSTGLLEWIEEGQIPPRRVILPTELQVRQSHKRHP
tara:strand:+ start:6139 stop:7206 length:1068 start_codon:yes stop_codon:yes gene_type:complete